MKRVTIGMLAAVDSGKTTLTEAILYTTGQIRKAGRVDHGDSHLDTDAIERERGITIFSKQAEFEHGSLKATILDTPGHVDFAAEMERTLSVIDYAVLIIGANDGIKAHTATLWKLLARHRIPVFIFVNKTDLVEEAESSSAAGASGKYGKEAEPVRDGREVNSAEHGAAGSTDGREVGSAEHGAARSTDGREVRMRLLDELSKGLGADLIDFTDTGSEEFIDDISIASDKAAELVLSELGEREKREAIDLEIIRLIKERAVFPVWFGSALKFSGVDALIDGLERYTQGYRGDEKGAASGRIFKVAYDGKDRITFIKITVGKLKPRQIVMVVPRDGGAARSGNGTGSGGALRNNGAAHAGKSGGSGDSSYRNSAGSAGGTADSIVSVSAGPASDKNGADAERSGAYDEKINEIRLYSGEKYSVLEAAGPGEVVAVTGLSAAVPGDAIGDEQPSGEEVLQPYMSYNAYPEDPEDTHALLEALSMLAAEDPKLETEWLSGPKQIVVRIMGAVQLAVLTRVIKDRFGISCAFGEEKIIYKETVSGTYEGVGHFEPLRHYAEVHVLISPAERGSGVTIRTECPLELLDINWQNLCMSVLERHLLRGPLIGAPLTDVDICLAAGRASKKHTEGGDFREAALRAVRQGLMQALAAGDMVLLEPWLDFRVETETPEIGAIMTDIDNMGGCVDPPVLSADGSSAVLTGRAPAAGLRGYGARLAGSAHGRTEFSCAMGGYDACKDAEGVIGRAGYAPERDIRNPADSVFCSHGSGDIIKWDQVFSYMHVSSVLEARRKHVSLIPGDQTDEMLAAEARIKEQRRRREKLAATDKELKAIFEQTYGPIKHYRRPKEDDDYYDGEYDSGAGDTSATAGSGTGAAVGRSGADNTAAAGSKSNRASGAKARTADPAVTHLFVDGYNLIHAWPELKELADIDFGSARDELTDIICNYSGFMGCDTVLVYDAYKVTEGIGSRMNINGITVVYTREHETADAYIERETLNLMKHIKAGKSNSLSNNGNSSANMARRTDISKSISKNERTVKANTHDRIIVVTSDNLEQIVSMGHGALRISSREFIQEIARVNEQIRTRGGGY